MPKYIELWNQHIKAEKGTEIDRRTGQTVDNWTLIFTDKMYGDEIRITFREDTRKKLVQDLSGGIVTEMRSLSV